MAQLARAEGWHAPRGRELGPNDDRGDDNDADAYADADVGVSENAVETCSPSRSFKKIRTYVRTYVPETDVRTNVCAYVRTLNE